MHDHDHEHDHQTPGSTEEPGVDAGSGKLEQHCSQCGSLIEGSDEFCQVCAIEYSGGEVPEQDATDAARSAAGPAAGRSRSGAAASRPAACEAGRYSSAARGARGPAAVRY